MDFTDNTTEKDNALHGTFMSSVIGSKNPDCPGIAPDAEIYVIKVFNAEQESYTSWFLEAFNYAEKMELDIINLSNGSSDFKDEPFTKKLQELIEGGMIVVSAIGNEGPELGTLSNPGDMPNVIGVGSLNQDSDGIASFSSRGVSTWALTESIGIIKPDFVTLGENIPGFDSNGNCIVRSGTSVSASVVSGTIAAVLSGIKDTPLLRNAAV